MTTYEIILTDWGHFGFVVRERKLVETFLPQGLSPLRQGLRDRWPEAQASDQLWLPFQRQVRAYFKGSQKKFDVPIDLSDCTPFQQAVLEACQRVPYGQTASYADLGKAIGKPLAARAVGGAMGANPLPLIIPCHRIVASNGTIGGFSSTNGLGDKARLLKLEGVVGFEAHHHRSLRNKAQFAHAS